MKYVFLMIMAVFVSSITVQANGKKRPPISITFHFEAHGLEGRKLSIPVQTALGKKYIERSPAISTNDIIAYHAFVSPHPDGAYGVALQLNKAGALRLRQLSAARKGQYIVCNVNGKVVDMLLIDRVVDGRVITIWRNIDPQFLALVNPILPRIGESKKQWKKRLKEERKRK